MSLSTAERPLPLESASPISWLGRRVDRFFFDPATPTALGLLRIIFFGFVLGFYWSHDFSDWSTVPRSSFRPVWIFQRLGLKVLPDGTIEMLQMVWTGALACATVGFLTPLAIALSLGIGLYLFGLPSSFGKVGHGDAGLLIVMGFFLFSRCFDALSLDLPLLRRLFGYRPPARSGEYRWPIRMGQIMLAIIFCASGFSKLMFSGLAWATSDHLQILLMQHRYGLKDPPWPAAATFFAERPTLCKLMAAGSLALEVLFPLALFSRWLRAPIVLGALSMQVGIGLMLGIYFWQFLLMYVFYLPWTRWFGGDGPAPAATDAPPAAVSG